MKNTDTSTPPESVVTVDCQYVHKGKAAAYLVIEGSRAAFIDNNTAHAIPHLMAALEEHGLKPEQVDYAIVTHVHLDHAGGTGALVKQCPNAQVLAHPKAARHLADPSKLVKGAKAVYGEEQFHQLYGEIEPVPEDRIRSIHENEVVHWGDRSLRFFHTLGHASHHFSIYDSLADVVFTGDSFGIGRTGRERPGPNFVACSCSPPEFDPLEAKISAEKIVSTSAKWACLGHFGAMPDLKAGEVQLLHSINQMAAIMKEAAASDKPNDELDEFCQERVRQAFREHLEWCEVEDLEADMNWLDGDVFLNGAGVAYAAKKKRKQEAAKE